MHPNARSTVHEWNQCTLDAIGRTKKSPVYAARALAMVHTAMFNAWASYDDLALSTMTYGRLRRKPEERNSTNRKKAFSFAAYRVLNELFLPDLESEAKDLFRNYMNQLGFDPDDVSMDINTPQGIGNLAGQMVLEYFSGDGSNDKGTLNHPPYSDYTGYKPVNDGLMVGPFPNLKQGRLGPPKPLNDNNRWQPLVFSSGGQTFLAAHWGFVKPFALENPWQFRPKAPSRYPSEKFEAQMDEVIQISGNLNEEQKMICEYWLGGPGTITPPGIWCEVGQFVSREHDHRNSQDVMMFFALANALHDAAIAAWDCKTAFDFIRPISAIRALRKGVEICAWGGPCQGSVTMDGSGWTPYQPKETVTPPFAEYVSGHSTFSAAAAHILQCFTGSDKFGGSATLAACSSKIEPECTPSEEITLYWETFSAAANQAGMSRRYGGLHFQEGDLEGRALGKKVGECVWEKALCYFNGKPIK